MMRVALMIGDFFWRSANRWARSRGLDCPYSRVTLRRYLFVGTATLTRLGSAILDSVAKRKKRSALEDGNALEEP